MNESNVSRLPPLHHVTSSSVKGTVWACAFGAESFLIVVSNLLTVAVFLTGRQLRKRSTYCLLNLSAADLLVGAIPMPMFVYLIGVHHSLWELTWDMSSWRNVYMPVDMMCAFSSIFCLVLLALERIYATLMPFRHRQLADRGYLFAIIAVWSAACTISLASYFSLAIFHSQPMSTYIPMTSLCIAVLIMVISYFLIWFKVKCHNNTHGEGCHVGRKMTYERKLAKTLFIVTTASLLAWLPFVVTSTAASFYKITLDFEIVLAVKLLHYSNSLINPVIYTFKIREFRRALSGMVRGRTSSFALQSGHVPLEVIRSFENLRIASLRS
ncbi:alpha-1A adrenergic receptor [Nematostella vectensis]|uniref:alpha-1A adrenergic receptor n=1 Tax=Nematostella vectensis TaxID=45351 RepID=UPI0020778031|nr:alpha-1A adrenergic receptor [Nematostella vectensis]XP_032230817.2 alpha-1A adrenergic receptor [Nematostella vectensis]